MSLNSSLVPFDWFEIRSSSRCPSLRVGHSSSFSRLSSQIYLLGGANPSECFSDLHSLSLPSPTCETFIWTKIIGEDSRLRRYEHSAGLTNDEQKIVFFGGANTETNFNDVHALDLSKHSIEDWTSKENQLVSPRTHHASCCLKNGLFIFSGGLQGAKAVDDTELYRLDFGNSCSSPFSTSKVSFLVSRSWSRVPTHGVPPEPRHGHCLLGLNDRHLYLHGGMDGRTFFSSLFSIDFNEDTPRWKEHKSVSAGPTARAAHGGVSLDSTSTLIIFGGLSRQGQALNDTWSWASKSEQWTEIVCRSVPRPRLDFAYCLVETAENIACLFVHGGTDTQGDVFDDCFLLRLTFDRDESVASSELLVDQ